MSEKILIEILKELKGQRGSGPPPSTTTADLVSSAEKHMDPSVAKQYRQELEKIRSSNEGNLVLREREASLVEGLQKNTTNHRIELEKQLLATTSTLQREEEILRTRREVLGTLEDQIAAAKELGFAGSTQLVTLLLQKGEIEDAYKTSLKDVTATRLKGELLTKQADALDSIGDRTEVILNKLNLTSKGWQNSFFGKLEILGDGDIIKGLSSAFGEMGKTLKTVLTPANLVGMAQSQIVESTIMMVAAQDQALASFNRSTGAAGRYDSVISEVRSQTFKFGVDIQAASEAILALTEDFTSFSSMSKEAQIRLGVLGATLNRIGLDTRQFANFMESATKSMGLSSAEAEQAILKMTGAAMKMGIPIGRLASQLQAVLPQLAAFGREAPKVFLQAAAAAKKMGIETGKLFDAMSVFDTFGSAAEATAKLNAALGTNINMMELVEASTRGPMAQMVILKEGLDRGAASWDNMGVHMRRLVASAVGQDLDTVSKMIRMNVTDMQAYVAEAEQQVAHQEQIAAAAKASAPAIEKLTTMFQQMAIAVQPIIDLLTKLVGGIVWLVDEVPALVYSIIGLVAAFKIWATVTSIQKAITLGMNGISISTKGLALRIGLLGLAFGLLYYIFAVKSNSPVLYLLLPLIAAGFWSISRASLPLAAGLRALSGPLAQFGAALALVLLPLAGLALAAAAAGLALGFMFKHISIEKALALAATLGAVALFVPFAIPAALGIAALAVGLLLLAGALAFISTTKLEALASVFKGITEMPAGSLGGLGPMLKTAASDTQVLGDGLLFVKSIVDLLSVSFNSLAASLGLFSALTMFAFGSVLETFKDLAGAGPAAIEITRNTADLFKATAEIDTTAVDNASVLIDSTIRMAEAVKEAGGGSEVAGFLSQLTNLLKVGEEKKGEETENRPIILSMDPSGRDVIAKGIVDNLMPYINKRLDIRT